MINEFDTLFWTIALVLIVGIVSILAYLLIPKVLEFLKKADDPTAEISKAMSELDKTLDKIKAGGNRGNVLVIDAQVQAMTLVNLVRGFVLKAEDFKRDIAGLQFAQEAIVSNDPLKIAEAAGYVNDQEISQLMLLESDNPQLWLSVSKMIASQVGTLRQWEETYTVFSTRLISDISSTKGRVAKLQASLDLLSAVEPLARIEANLSETKQLLKPQSDSKRLIEGKAVTVGARLLRG